MSPSERRPSGWRAGRRGAWPCRCWRAATLLALLAVATGGAGAAAQDDGDWLPYVSAAAAGAPSISSVAAADAGGQQPLLVQSSCEKLAVTTSVKLLSDIRGFLMNVEAAADAVGLFFLTNPPPAFDANATHFTLVGLRNLAPPTIKDRVQAAVVANNLDCESSPAVAGGVTQVGNNVGNLFFVAPPCSTDGVVLTFALGGNGRLKRISTAKGFLPSEQAWWAAASAPTGGSPKRLAFFAAAPPPTAGFFPSDGGFTVSVAAPFQAANATSSERVAVAAVWMAQLVLKTCGVARSVLVRNLHADRGSQLVIGLGPKTPTTFGDQILANAPTGGFPLAGSFHFTSSAAPVQGAPARPFLVRAFKVGTLEGDEYYMLFCTLTS